MEQHIETAISTPSDAQTVPLTFPDELSSGNVKQAMTGISSGDAWKVPLDRIYVVPGLNVRTKNAEYTAHVESVARSMMAEGFYPDKPLGVFIDDQNRICLRDGHTRYEAAILANQMGAQIFTVPCMTALKGTSMVDITVGLVKSNTGRPLLPIEVAVVCKRLVNWGWETEKIAERLDYTSRYVDELLGLLSAPAALVELVSAGKVSASTAMKEIKTKGAKEATKGIVEASKGAKGGKVTRKTLRKAVGVTPKKATAAKKAPASKRVTQSLPFADGPAPDATAVVLAVFDDPAFASLSDAVQSMVLRIAAP